MREAWNTLKIMHVSVDRVKEAHVQNIKSEFEKLHMKDTESVDDFAMKLTSIVSEIRSLGDKMEESYIVRKFLRTIPGKFAPIVTTLEQFGDLKAMMVEELVDRLKAHEEGVHRYGDREEEHLLLTHVEWEAKSVKKDSEGSINGSKSKKDEDVGTVGGVAVAVGVAMEKEISTPTIVKTSLTRERYSATIVKTTTILPLSVDPRRRRKHSLLRRKKTMNHLVDGQNLRAGANCARDT